jgi:hypothetical protein
MCRSIAREVFIQEREQTVVFELAFVDQLHGFGRAGNGLVVPIENGYEIAEEGFAFLKNLMASKHRDVHYIWIRSRSQKSG